MAESEVAVAPLENSTVDTHTPETTPPPEEVAPPPNNTAEEVEKEENEKNEEEEAAEVQSGKETDGEEIGLGNQDLKRKHEVQGEMERQLEEAGNGENGNEEGEDRDESEAKRQRTEPEVAQELDEGEEHEEEFPARENGEHDMKENLEQTAEEDVHKDNFTTTETETTDAPLDTSRQIEVPNHRVGVLIGKSGDTIRTMQKLSGAKIQIVKDSDTAPNATARTVEILGSVESIDKAEQLIRDVLAEADAGRPPPLSARGFSMSQSGNNQVEIEVPNDKVGSIIGKGGQMIKDLQARSGAHILLIPQQAPEGEDVKERTVRLTGNRQQIEAAKSMIRDVITQTGRPHSQNRGGPGHRQNYGPRGPGPRGYGYQKHGGPPRQHHQSPSTGFNNYPQPRGKNYPQQNYGNYSRAGGPRPTMGSTWNQRGPFPAIQQQPQYGAGGGPQFGQQQPPQGYGAPNSYQQNALPPQQSFQSAPPQQFYGQQQTQPGFQPGFQQQTFNAMYPQGQAMGGSYGPDVPAQQQNPYGPGSYGQSYGQSSGADAYNQQYAQQYPQQASQVGPGFTQTGQVGPAYNQPSAVQGTMNYGFQGAMADPSAGFNVAAGQAGYGQVMPVNQAGLVQQQPVSQGGFDQGTMQPAVAGGAPPVGGQWQG